MCASMRIRRSEMKSGSGDKSGLIRLLGRHESNVVVGVGDRFRCRGFVRWRVPLTITQIAVITATQSAMYPAPALPDHQQQTPYRPQNENDRPPGAAASPDH